ncbi:MAG TPA: mersacidin/lichenicidin family type 2 lantibiotic [Haliangium sp.]|nr:mersacidin/lichenicidin family type 2 lantibiotic [Haliangium sp.]
MKISDIIRAWKDPEFRATLENAPESPAGLIELDDAALESVGGAAISVTEHTEGCTVSGWQISCGYVCTATTECYCTIVQ